MAVSLNNLPADAVVGWEDRTKVSSPADGEILLSNDAGTGFDGLNMSGGGKFKSTTGPIRDNFDTEGDWGLSLDVAHSLLELGRRGASELDSFNHDATVYNVRDYRVATDTSWDQAFNRCFQAIWDNKIDPGTTRLNKLIIPYDADGYDIANTIVIPALAASSLNRHIQIEGYGARLYSTGGLKAMLYAFSYSPGLYNSICGLTLVGETDVDNLAANEKYQNEVGPNYDYEGQLRDISYPRFQSQGDLTGLQIGIHWGAVFSRSISECQFHDLGLAIEVYNPLGSDIKDCAFHNCNTAIKSSAYSSSPAGTKTGPVEFCTTENWKRCRYYTTKSNYYSGLPFIGFAIDLLHIEDCTIIAGGDLRNAVWFGLWSQLHPVGRVSNLHFETTGEFRSVIQTTEGRIDGTYTFEDIRLEGSSGPLCEAFCLNSITPASFVFDCPCGFEDYETAGTLQDWSSESTYQIGDRVAAATGLASPYGNAVKFRYRAIADPGIAGANPPHEPWHCQLPAGAGFSTTPATVIPDYSAGKRVYWNGKIWECTGVPQNTYALDIDIAGFQRRTSGDHVGKLQLTSTNANALKVGDTVFPVVGGPWQRAGATEVVEIIDSTNFVIDLTWGLAISETISVTDIGSGKTNRAAFKITDPTGFLDTNTVTIVDHTSGQYTGGPYDILTLDDTQPSYYVTIDEAFAGGGTGLVEFDSYPLTGKYRTSTNPSNDPEELWTEIGDAVWYPEMQDVMVGFTPIAGTVSSANLGEIYTGNWLGRIKNLVGFTAPTMLSHNLFDHGQTYSLYLEGISSSGAWQVAGETTRV